MKNLDEKNEPMLLGANRASIDLFDGVRSGWDLLTAARKKQMPHVVIGKRVFFSPEAIREWIKEQSVASIQTQEPDTVNGIRRLK